MINSTHNSGKIKAIKPLGAVSLIAVLFLCSGCRQKPPSLIYDLERFYNAQDTSRLLRRFSEDISLELEGILAVKGREKIRQYLACLHPLGSHIHFSGLQTLDQTIVGIMAESNRLFVKSGMGKACFQVTFRLDGKRIETIRLQMTGDTEQEFSRFFDDIQLWIAGKRQRYLSWMAKENLKIDSPAEFREWCALLDEWMESDGDKNAPRGFDSIMNLIGVKPGMVVADVGAGDGYYSLHLAKKVGRKGKIYSTDIEDKCLKTIQRRCVQEQISNIVTSLGGETEARLPADKFDMVFLRHTLHCMSKPAAWLKSLTHYIQPETRLVIIDGDPDILGYGWEYENTREEVIAMAEEAGFRLERLETSLLPEDYLYIFRMDDPSP